MAFDAAHGAWLISTLPVLSSAAGGGVLVSRSTDGKRRLTPPRWEP